MQLKIQYRQQPHINLIRHEPESEALSDVDIGTPIHNSVRCEGGLFWIPAFNSLRNKRDIVDIELNPRAKVLVPAVDGQY